MARLKPGLDALLDDRTRYRQDQYEAFRRYWAQLRDEGVWEELRTILCSRADACFGDTVPREEAL